MGLLTRCNVLPTAARLVLSRFARTATQKPTLAAPRSISGVQEYQKTPAMAGRASQRGYSAYCGYGCTKNATFSGHLVIHSLSFAAVARQVSASW